MPDPDIQERIDFNERLKAFRKGQEKIKATTPDGEGDIDWQEAGQTLLEKEAQESVVITVEELLKIEFPPQQWIIDRFLPEGGITMIVGEAGTLKSYISLYIAKILLLGEKLFGQFETHRQCKILLVDKENKLPRIQRRMIGLNSPASPEMWIIQSPSTFILEDKQWVEYTKNFIKEKGIDVVIMDSFIDFFTGNENSSTDTAQAMNAIRSLSQTAQYILLHHDSKPVPKLTRTAAQKTRGSSNIIAQVDTQFYFEKSTDNKTIIIEQGKSRDSEPLPKFEVNIISEAEKGVTDFVYKGEVKDEVSKVKEAEDFIMNYLGLSPYQSRQSIIDNAENNGITKSAVERAILVLKENKLLNSKPEGRKKLYFILIPEDEEETTLEEESESKRFLENPLPYVEPDE